MHRAVALILLLPATAYAEVMDKEPSLLVVCFWSIIGILATFCSSRFKPRLLFLVIPAAFVFFVGQLTEISDQYIHEAIVKEAGILYIAISWLAPALIITSGFIGWLLRRRATP